MVNKNSNFKILVMRYRFIGDTLLTIPFLRNLRYAYPDAQIDMLVAPVSGEIIEECPYVDNFIYFDTTKKHRYENTLDNETKTFWNYVKLLKNKKYDKVYVLKRSFSSAFLAFMSGIKERVGFDTEGRGFLLTKGVKYKENLHEIECFLDVLRVDGIEIKDNYLENWITQQELEQVQIIMKMHISEANFNKAKVIVHATSGNRKKEWDYEKWAEIIEWLSNEKGVQVVFNGTKDDSSVYEKILSFVKKDLDILPVNFCGCFNLRQTLAFTKSCNLIVGCDSGNLHIAASVGLPVVGIYGPMNTVKWQAFCKNNSVIKTNLPCQPCGLKVKCKNGFACIKNITVSSVKSEVERFLKDIVSLNSDIS